MVSRLKGASPEDTAYHRELHHIARIFYAGTNIIALRDAARSAGAQKNSGQLSAADSTTSSASSDPQSPEVSLLTVEMACSRRRIEVPDDDSSFLLRAQVCHASCSLIAPSDFLSLTMQTRVIAASGIEFDGSAPRHAKCGPKLQGICRILRRACSSNWIYEIQGWSIRASLSAAVLPQ